MIRKIPENTTEGIRYLFCKVHKFENQIKIMICTINNNDNNKNSNCSNNDSNNCNNSSSINNSNNKNIQMMMMMIIIIIIIIMIIIIIKSFTANSRGLVSKFQRICYNVMNLFLFCSSEQ